MGFFDWLKQKATETLSKVGEATVYAFDKTVETVSGGKIDIWDDSNYSWNRNQQTQTTTTQNTQDEANKVINNYLNTLKQQGLYKENQEVKKTSSGGIISPKNAGVTYYKVQTDSGTKLVRVDYSKGTVETYDYDEKTNTIKPSSSSSVSGRLVSTQWETEKGRVEVPKEIASVANKQVRKVILDTTQKSVNVPVLGNIKVDDYVGSIPFAGQAYRAVKTIQATKQLNNILKQNKEAYYDVYRASKYLQRYQTGKLVKETVYHGAAIATSALAGEVMGSALAGKAASQAGKLATLRVGASLATAGAAENALTTVAYDKIVEGRNPTKAELIQSAALGALSAGLLGTAINRLHIKGRVGTSKFLLRASYGLDPYEWFGDVIGDEIKRGLRRGIRVRVPKISPTVTFSPTPSVSPSPSPSVTPSVTPSTTPSTTPSITPSTTPSVTPSTTPTITPTPSPTPTPTITPTPSPSPTPGITPSPTPSLSPNPTPSNTPTNTPSPTPTTTPTPTPVILPLRQPFLRKLRLFGLMPIPPAGSFGGSSKAGRTRVRYYNELKAARIFMRKLFGV